MGYGRKSMNRVCMKNYQTVMSPQTIFVLSLYNVVE